MRMCNFPGCQHLHGHASTTPHATWSGGEWVPLPEQRTRRQILADSRDRMRREKAEKIAADNFPSGHWIQGDADVICAALTAAALQALTESENAR